MLMRLRDCVQLAGSITLTDLARQFDVQESAMQGMMEHWVRKGVVKIVSQDLSCNTGGCSSCSQGCSGSLIKYVWHG